VAARFLRPLPVDFEVWDCYSSTFTVAEIQYADHLKQHLIKQWTQFIHDITDHAVQKQHIVLHSCIEHDQPFIAQTVIYIDFSYKQL